MSVLVIVLPVAPTRPDETSKLPAVVFEPNAQVQLVVPLQAVPLAKDCLWAMAAKDEVDNKQNRIKSSVLI